MTKYLILLLLFLSCSILMVHLVGCQQPQVSIPTPQQSGDSVQEQLPQVSVPTPQQSGDSVQQPSFKVFGSHHIVRPLISHFKPHHSHGGGGHHVVPPHMRGSPHPQHS